MERLTRPDVDVTEYADKFLNTRLKGKEIDWKRTNDAGIDLLINAITCDEFSKDVFRQMARDLYGRLKAYEDTGMTTEEVLSMSGEWCAMMSVLNSIGVGYDRLRELDAADKDGRVVVLPCKVWKKIYYINGKYIIEVEVTCYTVDKTGAWLFVGETYNPETGGTCHCNMRTERIGKDVFLTREEAERALQEMEGK